MHDDHDLRPGRILGPYELLVPVDSGGMARVWAARHRGGGEIIALKMLMPHLAGNAAFREMFFDEAQIASRIRHENVARTFELVELDGVLSLVMEWVDGSSMIRMMRPSGEGREEHPPMTLPLRHAVKIVAETCAGLHAAHELVGDDGRPLAVVHRDVSPHNILLTLDGRVKVTDFGVAKAIGKSHMTIAGHIKGKLAYMSPEQLAGGGVDRRSDIFSLGSVLYESTTGQRPFRGKHDPQIMAAIMMGSVRPPRALMRRYPKELEDIVMRALATEPAGRYATALQLKQALEGWLASNGPPIGATQIALLLEERCGAELSERRSALSPPAPREEPAPPPPAPAPSAPAPPMTASPLMTMSSEPRARVDSSGAIELDRRSLLPRRRPSKRTSVLSMVLAALVGAALGLCVLVYVQSVRRERKLARSAAAAASAAAASAAAASAAVDEAPPLELDELPGEAALSPPAEVKLRLPHGARLYVDGAQLPAGTTSVARPEAGVVTVLVTSDAHQDAVVEIAPTSPEEIEVTMVSKPKPRRAPPPPPKPTTITMPPNPYD